MIRATSTSINDSMIYQVNETFLNEQQLENEVTTGLRVQNPSDDPSAIRSILDERAGRSICIWLDRLLSAKQRQLEDFEKAVHVLKSDLAEPFALHINRRKNVFLLVGTVVVSRLDFLPRCVGFRALAEPKKVIDKKIVKQFLT